MRLGWELRPITRTTLAFFSHQNELSIAPGNSGPLSRGVSVLEEETEAGQMVSDREW